MEDLNMKITARLIGEVEREPGWRSDHWYVTLKNTKTGESFKIDYYTGLGMREYKATAPGHVVRRLHNGKMYSMNELDRRSYARNRRITLHMAENEIKGTPVKPDPLGVLSCIRYDISMSTETFEDWCMELGYDTDSRKALDLYLKIQEIAVKFRRCFPGVNLDDYAPLEDY